MNQRILSGSILDEEIELETEAVRRGVNRYRQLVNRSIDKGEASVLKPVERLMLHWIDPLVDAIKIEKRQIRYNKPGTGRAIYGPVLMLVDAQRLAVITMSETFNCVLAEPDGVKQVKLSYAIGRAVLAECNVDKLRRADRERLDGIKDRMHELTEKVRKLNPMRVNWWANRTLSDPIFDKRVCVQLGECLLTLLRSTAASGDYDKFVPAIRSFTRRERNKGTSYIKLDRATIDVIDEGHHFRQALRPRYLPMIVPPYPWQPDAEGGYIHIRTPFISKPRPIQKQAIRDADISQVYECLNAVNVTPWRINRRILQAVTQIWDSGGGDVGVPQANDTPVPPQPTGGADTPEYKKWRREMAEIRYKNKRILPGERRLFLERLSVATMMKDREQIWFPHQLDYRTRAYPIPPHLNHQGPDTCRAMLEFAEPKPLDDRAREHLMVHAANTCGADKLPYRERLAWMRQNIDAFRGWAANPMENTGWMLQDEPFQALAAAFAIADPEAAARLPIHRDGTCNGLQHYAALGRDPIGARAVNLTPSEAPNDVYAEVAGIVHNIVAPLAETKTLIECKVKHFRGEHKGQVVIENVPIPQWILPHINRKVTKHTVMTTVYGVTMVGAREQVRNALVEAGMKSDPAYKASMYLANVVMAGVGEVCVSARVLMGWLQRCARIIAEANHPVRWTTPLGFPVIQPYRKWRSIRIKTVANHLSARVDDDEIDVHRSKQIAAFAPNYIHSLDGTHMLNTARTCRRQGITFAAVHDSYGTHAATVTDMDRILRQEFITLHKQPLLENLLSEFQQNHPDLTFPDIPPYGDFDINQVRDSPYFFS